MVADSREGACATSKEGSPTGEMTHREEKKTEGSTSSSSDSDVNKETYTHRVRIFFR